MWLFRELVRFVWMIAVTVAIAAVAGALVALLSGGSVFHDLRICFFVFGALLVLLACGGNRSTASARRANWGIITPAGFRGAGWVSPAIRRRPGDPTMTVNAVFFGGGVALIALGLAV